MRAIGRGCCFRWWCLQLILIPTAFGWFVGTRSAMLVKKYITPSEMTSHTSRNKNRRNAPRFAHPDGAVSSNGNLTEKPQTAEAPPALRQLYPPSVAYENGTLQVDSIHTLYYEIHGEGIGKPRTGKSALFLHGGPGAGCTPNHARFFDANAYGTIVLFDQRGCGRSVPRGQIFNNTLSLLIEDCERLRHHILGQEGVWDVVLGGSWGSTLAVAYAQEYPSATRSLILRGVCLLRPSEVDWLFSPQGGAAKRNPQAWQSFGDTVGMGQKPTTRAVGTIGPDVPFGNEAAQSMGSTNTVAVSAGIDRNVLHRYYDRFFGVNTTDRWTAARGWMMWEFTVSSSFKQHQQANGNQSDASIPQSQAVLVSPPNSEAWSYEDIRGNTMEPHEIQSLSLNPASVASMQLRQGLPHSRETPVTPRPIGMTIHNIENAKDERFGNFSGLPAMPMLTCFYSVNDQFAMNGWTLLDPERMKRIRHIPCIAVQGGRDPICPPDTALDLQQMWPEMELRIPLGAGHSMYHPELAHELVQATDRMAKLG